MGAAAYIAPLFIMQIFARCAKILQAISLPADGACEAPALCYDSPEKPTGLRIALPQDFFHRFSLGELIDELVQIANLSHQRLCDFFHANATDHARSWSCRCDVSACSFLGVSVRPC